MSFITRRGLMLVVSSPSGAGKTTLAKRLLQRDQSIAMSVSVTTRAPRPGEIEGVDYFFVSQKHYLDMLTAGHLLEHAQIFDHSYGTPKGFVLHKLAHGHDVLCDINWQGAQQMRATLQQDLVSIFILPPSIEALEARLKGRQQDSATVIKRRMNEALEEMSHWQEYDYVMINDDIEESTALAQAILTAERAKRQRLTGMEEFVHTLHV